ncbi:ABC transporter permease [Photobacterium aquae]|uniref:ABC transporter permease n=1 Tax=Photobacterium aquae TaxID=1195763 RepID=A0A0J1HDC6_9GAMM|nr:FtsX-like permease family protein [Photobacterium aquae]KLV09631.1 ABC transporter permease [Photobacterium aquae]
MGKLTLRVISHSESYRLAWRNIWRNRRRSLLSVTIIAIAVFALSVAGGFGLYTYHSLQEAAARDSGHLILSQPGFFEKDEEMPLSNGLERNSALEQAIVSSPMVRSLQPRIYLSGLVSNGNKSTIFTGTGVTAREFAMKGPFLTMIKGKTLSSVNSPRYNPAEPQIMLGEALAANLQLGVGDWATLLATTRHGALNAIDFKVRGIFSTGVPELDKRQLYIHLDTAQSLLDSNRISTLSVFLFDTPDTERVSGLIGGWAEQFVEGELAMTPWHERAFFYTSVRALYDRIFGLLGSILGLVVFVALFNTMTMSVAERTRETGTLMALGSPPSELVRGFLREAGLLAVLGSLAGALLAASASVFFMVADIWMPPPPGHSEGYPLQVYFSWPLVLAATIGCVAICLLAAWFSARKGVGRPITEALAYV